MIIIVHEPSPRCKCGQLAWLDGECSRCAGARIAREALAALPPAEEGENHG